MNISGPHATPSARFYFGYGSNLWRRQMTLRCPTSNYLGIARLDGYKWIINSRGYANVVQCRADDRGKDCVWGMAYSLVEQDEIRLDINEGVPESYTKESLEVNFWPSASSYSNIIDTSSNPAENVQMLVYIDRDRTDNAQPRKEYIERMNHGIKDALNAGVPEDYVERCLRKFIPAPPASEEHASLSAFALKQAMEFVDEED